MKINPKLLDAGVQCLRNADDTQRIYKDFKEFYDRLLILRREKSGGMEDILLAMATGYDYRKYQKSKPSK